MVRIGTAGLRTLTAQPPGLGFLSAKSDFSAQRIDRRTSHKISMTDDKYLCLIGAQKSGTTSLYRYLATHPAIHTIRWKECKYFLTDSPSRSEQRRYAKLLRERSPEQYIFETSTYYTKFPQYAGVPQRIARQYPDAKLIYLVRDPVERIWSQYSHYLAKDWERKPFAEAVRDNNEYLDYSRYHQQLSQYLDVFPPERIRVIVFEEFIAEREAGLRSIFEFLGIDAEFRPPNLDVAYNSGSSKRGMSTTKRMLFSLPGYRHLPWKFRSWVSGSVGDSLPQKSSQFDETTRSWLREQLAEDLERFVEFLGRDVPSWKCLDRELAGPGESASVL